VDAYRQRRVVGTGRGQVSAIAGAIDSVRRAARDSAVESWNPDCDPTGLYNMGRMIPVTHDTGRSDVSSATPDRDS